MTTKMTNDVPVLKIERAFNATPEKLWSYWTDPKKYAKWFNPAPLDLVMHEFDVRVGGKVRFDMPQPGGERNPQAGVFLKLDPFREIETGAPDRSFVIQVLFVPMGASMTRMVVNVMGVPPEYHAAATVGWNQGLDKLEKEIGGGPAIPTVAGPNVGFTIERTFKAAPEKVWRMWTHETSVKKWWFGGPFRVRRATFDVRNGGKFDIEMTHGTQTIHNHGTYREVTPYTRLAWDWHFDIFLAPGEKAYDVPISIDLAPVAGGTKMTFKEGPLATAENTAGSREGVLANVERLAKVLEG
ncbi:MAG: SRPBCC family protein [Thermoplasmatota archaeon]